MAELIGPRKLAGGDNAFAAPSNTTLQAGAVYAVRLEGGGAGAALRGTANDSETGESGWSVANDSLRRSSEETSYETSADALMIRAIEASERFDPFEPPLAPILTLSETTSADGTWTVSLSDAEAGDYYSEFNLEETSPGGVVETTDFIPPVFTTTITDKTVAGDCSYRVRGCRNLCSDWSASGTVTYAPPASNSRPVVSAISDLTVGRGSTGTRTANVTDGDSGDTHRVEATSSNAGVATVRVRDKTLTVTGVACGAATIEVTATDNSGGSNATSAAVEFDVTVSSSRPVVVTISDATVSRGSAATRTVWVSGGDDSTVSASSDDRSVATVSVSGKTLTLTGVARGTATRRCRPSPPLR